MRDQRLSASAHQNREGVSGLLAVPPDANGYGNIEDDDGHSPIGAVLRRRAERRERDGGRDDVAFDSDLIGLASVVDPQDANFRSRQPGRETNQHSHVSLSVTQHSWDRVRSPTTISGPQLIIPDMQTRQINAPRSTSDESPSKKSSHRASAVLDVDPSIRSSGPISYTPKGTPPRSAQYYVSLHSPTGKRPNGVAVVAPLDLSALPAQSASSSSLVQVVLAEGTSSRSNLSLGPANRDSSAAPNSVVNREGVVLRGPPTSTHPPSFLDRTRRNVSINIHPSSPVVSNSKAQHETHTETVTLMSSLNRQDANTSTTTTRPSRGLPISPARPAIAFLDADKYSGDTCTEFSGDNTAGNRRYMLEKIALNETGATNSDHKPKTQAEGIRTTRGRGRAGQESKQQSQIGKGVDADAGRSWDKGKREAYAETAFLSAIEELRAETREALIGIHVDIIKSGQAWKVSGLFPYIH